MGVGQSVIIDPPQGTAEIFVANQNAANAMVRSPRRLHVIGINTGKTSVFALNQQGRQIAALEFRTGRDVGALQQIRRAAMPAAALAARTVNDTSMLTGSVDSVEDAQRACDIVGRGPITIMAQAWPGRPPPMQPVRDALFSLGAHVSIIATPYPAGSYLAAPVRLSFLGIEATVTGRCGQWPRELAPGRSVDGWNNKLYRSFGCAYQTAFAAQAAGPRDLVAPQAETPAGTLMRSRAIESLRKGEDPGTNWKLVNSGINPVGAN